MNKKNNKRALIGILGIIGIISCSFFAYAALGDSGYYYFPNSHSSGDLSKNLSLTAKGPSTGIAYYISGYEILVEKNASGERELTSLEIKKPALHNNEVLYPGDYACSETGTPSGCYDIIYQFLWEDPLYGKVESRMKGSLYQTLDYVNVINTIRDNAYFPGESTFDKKVSLESKRSDKRIITKNTMLVKVFWGDDSLLNGLSFYSDISKKFVFRTKKSESNSIGIAETPNDLWKLKDGKYEIPAEDLWKAHLATINVGGKSSYPDSNEEMVYKAKIKRGMNKVHFLTVDFDNSVLDTDATPSGLRSYIDIYLMKQAEDKTWKTINKNGQYDHQPIMRVSPDVTGTYEIPATDQSFTVWDKGPSGSFDCPYSIGHPLIGTCITDSSDFYGITQHTVDIPDADYEQGLIFKLKNSVHPTSGNSFGIAGSISLYPDIPDDEFNVIVDDANDILAANTYVEVDTSGVKDEESDYQDDGKITQAQALHTYKTELCNVGSAAAKNVLVQLQVPEKAVLVGDGQALEQSSVMIGGSLLDDTIDESKKVDVSAIQSSMNLGTIEAGNCKYITYQSKIDNVVLSSDVITVQNKYKYDLLSEYKNINEVKNYIYLNDTDLSFSLTSIPVSNTEVSIEDHIEYIVELKNTGTDTISDIALVCPRTQTTTETTCEIGECIQTYEIPELQKNDEIDVPYTVQVHTGSLIQEQCELTYSGSTTLQSNIAEHPIVGQNEHNSEGTLSLTLDSRPDLINSPDGEPRADGLDSSAIVYTYRYTGNNIDYMYPNLSKEGEHSYGNVKCGPDSLPYKPNAYTYNVNSSNRYAQENLNLSSNGIKFNLFTQLPSSKPKTILHIGNLYPTHSISSSEANTFYKDGGIKVLPTNATVHRALENGSDGIMGSTIKTTVSLDKWQYVPYDKEKCQYEKECTNDGGCDSDSLIRYRNYTLYRWENISSQNIVLEAEDTRKVDVVSTTAGIRTRGGHVHTNDTLTEDGTDANIYDLGEAGFESVKSAPKLYSPPGSYHADYIVSTNTTTSNLKSKKGWYTIRYFDFNKTKGEVYARENAQRDYDHDVLVTKKHGEVKFEENDNLQNPLREGNIEKNTFNYYNGDLTIYNPSGTVNFTSGNGTIYAEGDMYIKSNMLYDAQDVYVEDLPYISFRVKGDVYIDPGVTQTLGRWSIEGTLYTGKSNKRLKHLGVFYHNKVEYQRTAPEDDPEINAPSEDIILDEQIFITPPPDALELDDGRWAIHTNVNLYSKEVIE